MIENMKKTITNNQKKFYEKIIEDATIDCKDEDEQAMGWECILDENIPTPCACKIGKQQAVLEKISSDENSNALIGVIKLNKTQMRILLQDIILDDPEAMKYINAYKYWCKNGW